MSGSFRRAAAASVAALAITAAAGAGSAAAATSPAESATADFMSGPFHVQFNAQRAANTPADAATGTFISHVAIGGFNLATLQGPVTCLDVRGNRMGLFYPVASSSPGAIASLIKGVFIYVTLSKTGHSRQVGFAPSLSASTKSCPPFPGIAPIMSGTVTLTG
jgi:hypothetical protein